MQPRMKPAHSRDWHASCVVADGPHMRPRHTGKCARSMVGAAHGGEHVGNVLEVVVCHLVVAARRGGGAAEGAGGEGRVHVRARAPPLTRVAAAAAAG